VVEALAFTIYRQWFLCTSVHQVISKAKLMLTFSVHFVQIIMCVYNLCTNDMKTTYMLGIQLSSISSIVTMKFGIINWHYGYDEVIWKLFYIVPLISWILGRSWCSKFVHVSIHCLINSDLGVLKHKLGARSTYFLSYSFLI
jgi:hypothetical protein